MKSLIEEFKEGFLLGWSRFWEWPGRIWDFNFQTVFLIKPLFSWTWRGQRWTARIHKFIRADPDGCFHTHPSYAWRLILWGGYTEEIMEVGVRVNGHSLRTWRPGQYGWVEPSFCHRIDTFVNGRSSYSLWIVGPKVATIKLHGWGWPK